MNRKIIAIIVLGLVLLASLLACGYFGVKTLRRTRLRRSAMTAYENKEYMLAERLLLQYVAGDPNAEAEYVALANIYHEFGNAGLEAQMWQTASSLNPLKPEYREKMLTSAMRSAGYSLLHGILGRKEKSGEKLTDQELFLYVISSYRTGHPKDGDDAFQKAEKDDPEAFHKNELGRMAEFMAHYSSLSEAEQDNYLKQAMESEDPVIRFEAILYTIRRIRKQVNGETDKADEIEALLKQAVETNSFAGTIYLADFYYSKLRFSDVIAVLEPYLKTIDDPNMYLLYAESCVFEKKLDELKALKKKLSRKYGPMTVLADYCEILIAYLENDEEKLISTVRKNGNIIISPLSRFIRLRVAILNESFDEIRTVAQEIFSAAPFYDLQNRTMLLCLDYLSREMEKPENRDDPSKMAELAKLLSGYLQENRLLTEIMIRDQYNRNLLKEADLMAALEQFPDDAILQQVAVEYLVFNEKADQALPLIEQILTTEESKPDQEILFMYMLTLDMLERRDEARAVFLKLLDQSEFDLVLLNHYFQFCVKYERKDDLLAMADKLEPLKDGKLEHFGKFFRAAALLLTEDEEKKNEALDLLVSTPTGDPEFTFYAANRLCDNDRLDEAEAKYKAIQKTYRFPTLVLVNLSELYHARGDEKLALETAKEAFEKEKKSMLPAFIYAKRLSEAKRYEEAVNALKFPHHTVNYREDVVELWVDCMRRVIEKSMADRRYLQAEEQCKHLLIIAPNDEFGRETMEKLRELLKPKTDGEQNGGTGNAAPAA